MASFSDLKLDKRIVEILNSKGITTPTEIQLQTIAMARSGQDVLGISKTGTGKTLAFVIPLVSQILASNKPFHALIIVPTRELAQQISSCIYIFENLGIRQALLVGGEKFTPQVDAINKKPHIIVGTPNRIVKHIQKTKNLKLGITRKLVLDEADRFFEHDFIDELEIISGKLSGKNQALMFTATTSDKTEKLCSLFMKNPKIIKVSEKYEEIETLEESYALVPEKFKLTVLYNFLRSNGSSSIIVFVSLCTSARKISATLSRLGINCDCLHGKMPQSQRESVLSGFRDGRFAVLLSTDLASRGLDIPHVDMVINYDLPNNAGAYTHRVGRTARAGKKGVATTLLTQYDVINFQKLEFVLGRKLSGSVLELYQEAPTVRNVYKEVCEDRTFSV